MNSKLTITIIGVVFFLLFTSCSSPELKPATTHEPEIPRHFSTYTSEGLFSISYPNEWVPTTSIQEDVWEQVKKEIKSTDPEVKLEDSALIFMGGLSVDGGYNPSVNIIVTPRSKGYWTLEEIDEGESKFDREHALGYHEYSHLKTIVDGRAAIIIDCEDYNAKTGTHRYLQLTTVKDKFAWFVTCKTKTEDFSKYVDTFFSIVRSLRILN